MESRYNKINNMTLDQLKEEYYNCDKNDKVKRQILKKIIRNKLELKKEEYLEEKIMMKDIDDKLNNLVNLKLSAEKDKKIQKIKQLDQVIKKRGNMEQYWESNQTIDKIDDKFKPEIEYDHSNNKLMERLNYELDFRIYGSKSKDIIKPYSNQDEGNFRDFEKYSVPLDEDNILETFSSKSAFKRINNKK